MVDKRNRSVELITLLSSYGIAVNIAKNKAQGHKGFFKTDGKSYRIDIAKGLNDIEIECALLHEFAHYIHYYYDKTLKKLDFIIDEIDEKLLAEMIELTVGLIPKQDVKSLFEIKVKLNNEIKDLAKFIKKVYPDFKVSIPNKDIEKNIKQKGYGYLIKHDRVKLAKLFKIVLLSVDCVDAYFDKSDEILKKYLVLKSKQRYLKRINSRISRLNKYYNNNSELFARSIEVYFTDKMTMNSLAPNLKKIYDEVIMMNKIPFLTQCEEIFCKNI